MHILTALALLAPATLAQQAGGSAWVEVPVRTHVVEVGELPPLAAARRRMGTAISADGRRVVFLASDGHDPPLVIVADIDWPDPATPR